MTIRGPVLVGTDLSSAAEEALAQGAQLARDLKSQLLVCHVVPELLPDGSVFKIFRDTNATLQETVVDRARAAVQEELDRVLGDGAGAIDIVLDSGTPHVGLLRQVEATGAGVVAVGPGSIAMEVGRHTTASALVARPSPAGPVIGATDFSDASMPALQAAAFEAGRRGASLHLVHAFDMAVFAVGGGPAAAMPYLAGTSPIALEGLDDLRVRARERLEDTLRELGTAGEVHVLSGSAGAIISYAESARASLIVVGTHGRSGLERLTMGSTAAQVVEAAPCSVLIVR